MVKDKVSASKYIKMEINLKEIFTMTKRMDSEYYESSMETSGVETGTMESKKEQAYL